MQLKLSIFILCFVNTLICQETWKLSERVGNRIDPIEQEYFCLFPEIEGFRSASLAEQGKNGKPVLHVISRNDDKNDTTFIFPDMIFLNAYIENFESFVQNDCTSVLQKKNELIDINAFEDRIEEWREFKDIQMPEFILLNGTKWHGSIIKTFGDSLEILFNLDKYNWVMPEKSIIQFSIQEIDTIYYSQYESLGFGWGFLAGYFTFGLASVAISGGEGKYGHGFAGLAGGLVGGITFSSINSSDIYIDDIDVEDLSKDRKMIHLLRYYDLVYLGPVIPLELRK